MQRRRQLSQGKLALDGARTPPPAPQDRQVEAARAANGQGAPKAKTDAPTDALTVAQLGRALSMQRRRQLSQGKQALTGAGPLPRTETVQADADAEAGSGRDQARARRAEASRLGSAEISRPERQGRVRYVPKVVESPTHGGQHVTGIRIAPGVAVTGGEPGSSHPISGTQYVPADGPAPEPGAGVKVGLMRTPQGLVVSGTTVRGNVPITGDEAGEHLRVTGEADQKLGDDLTPRRDGAYRSAQFPRRADPHGATAVGTSWGSNRPGRRWRSPTTGWPSPARPSAAAGGSPGTRPAPAARSPATSTRTSIPPSAAPSVAVPRRPRTSASGRLDPVTAAKVTVAQTWRASTSRVRAWSTAPTSPATSPVTAAR